jgi:hypothetical protein
MANYVYIYMCVCVLFSGFWVKQAEYIDRRRTVDLLEGDVSDVDLDKSDGDYDLLSCRNEHAVPTSPVVPGLDPEMVEV